MKRLFPVLILGMFFGTLPAGQWSRPACAAARAGEEKAGKDGGKKEEKGSGGETGSQDKKKEDPVDIMARHLKGIMRIVKRGKKRNPAECKKIIKRVKRYAKKAKADCKRLKKTMKKMSKKERKKLDKKGWKVMGKLVYRYDPVMEAVIDGLLSTSPHKHHHHRR